MGNVRENGLVLSKEERDALHTAIYESHQKLILLYASLSYFAIEPTFLGGGNDLKDLCVSGSEKRQALIAMANCYDSVKANMEMIMSKL